MTILLSSAILDDLHKHAESHYPDEGAGMVLGDGELETRRATRLLHRTNNFELESRRRRYSIDPKEFLEAEREAEELGLDIIGIFHSHPDHPARPSDFDLEWAMPWYSYIITSVSRGKAVESRAWRLSDDRSSFIEEALVEVRSGSPEEVR
ncbi:MAG: hypothetical protein A2Z37_15425 [Chloroflexi bacterium RBG_19FT_COMBO_62_14]|nr:MAG: hypothetical protein A2Z37_15425 [Chloroflexi bacterium RBG_19FT_COMBO_62_14]